LVEDKLFSTLDPTTRRLELPDGRGVVFTDTVGFVRKLPHSLVEAFASTLEEAARADLLVHLVDGADPDPEGQYVAVRDVLGEIGAAAVPELVAVNKIDALPEVTLARLRRRFPEAVLLSALSGDGVEAFLERVAERIPRPDVEVELLVPYERGDVVAALHAAGAVVSEEYLEEGTKLRARLREDQLRRLEPYVLPSRRARRAEPS
jgi:GTP-binding protein HflX